jgi:hypothetical protein
MNFRESVFVVQRCLCFNIITYYCITQYLVTLNASSRKLFLVASGAVNFLVPGYKALGADGRLAYNAAKTFLMPLSGLVLHLFCS